MKFTVLAARIDGRGKVPQQLRMEFAPGEVRGQLLQVDGAM